MTKSTAPDAGTKALELLRDAETKYFAGQSEIRPSAATYNMVLDSLARSNQHGSELQAEELLYHMDQMAVEHPIEMADCKPDIVSFNTVLNSWSRSKLQQAPQRAEAILEHMERRHLSGESNVVPDTVSYNTVMTAWARSQQAMQNTERILNKMEKQFAKGNKMVEPTVISFNIFINAIAKSGTKDAFEKATEVFEKMKRLSAEENRPKCLPDCVTYSTIITIAAQATDHLNGGENRALKLLEELETQFEVSGDLAYQPTMQSYTSVS